MTSIREQARLEAIEHYGDLALSEDSGLNEIARLAARLCQAPVAAVSFAAGGRLFHAGRFGFDLRSSSEADLPSRMVTHTERPQVLTSAQLEQMYGGLGLSLEGRSFYSYTGVPVRTPDGRVVGVLSVLHAEAHRVTALEVDCLVSLSHMATTRLELLYRVRESQTAANIQQRAEAALTVERNFGAAVLDTVGALVVVCDPAGRIVRFNRYCELLSGFAATDLLGTYIWERLVPKEDVGAYMRQLERVRAGVFPVNFENDWLAADRTRRRISWTVTALTDVDGEVSFIITTGIDVTVQNEAEMAIHESEKRHRELVEGSLGFVYTHDLSGRILSINEQGARGLGRQPEDLVGRNLRDVLAADAKDELQPYFAALESSGEAQGLLHVEQTSGHHRVLAYKNRLVSPTEGEAHVLGFAVDVTEQLHTEEELRRLARQSQSVLESIGEGIYGLDLEGRVTVVNRAAARMLGYQPEELLGQNLHQMVHHSYADGTPYPESECPIRHSQRQLEPLRVSHEVFWRKDGTSFPVEYVACPQIQSGDTLGFTGTQRPAGPAQAVGVVVAFTDISERNALDRMKDEFVSTVSHELRTPLTSLRAALGLLAAGRLSTDPERTQQMLDIAVDSTDRLIRLVNDILDLELIGSGQAAMHHSECSVAALFAQTAALLEPGADRAGVRLILEPTDVVVWADAERLLQTLTNVVSNAIKFAPSDLSPSGQTEVVLSAHYAEPAQARIEVRDNGRGIPADHLQTIFNRFHQIDASDSRAMGGTGLGLAICRSIITQLGGTIWATSTLGEGSTFHISLPERRQ